MNLGRHASGIALLIALGICDAARAADIPRLSDIPLPVASAHPNLVTLRDRLVQERIALRNRTLDHNAACASVVSGSAADRTCASRNAQLTSERDAHIAASNRFNAAVSASATAPQYIPSGNGLVGGMTWIVGFNDRTLTPAQRKALEERVRDNLRRSGIESVASETAQYNFVIGVAVQTTPFRDLASRVIYDEFRLGRFSKDYQPLYASLKGRSFDQLACHSNGAMVCLAALASKDVRATNVVLYGPQITPEALMIYNKMLADGQIKGLTIHLNRNDPVPPTAMLASGPDGIAAALFAPFLVQPLYTTPVLSKAVSVFAPSATVRTHDCIQGFGAPCHIMTAYRAAQR